MKNSSQRSTAPRSPQPSNSRHPKGVVTAPFMGLTHATVQRAHMGTPAALTAHDVQHLQRSIGNRAVATLLRRNRGLDAMVREPSPGESATPIQAKLTVGPVGDAYEQEADQIAKQVINMKPVTSQNPSQRQEEGDEVQRTPLGTQITPLIQRHPSHADEEEVVQGKRLLQRHPGHSEEETVQTKAENGSLQRHPSHADEEEVVQGKRVQQHGEPHGKVVLRQQNASGVAFATGGDLDTCTESAIRASKGGGRRLGPQLRGSMEKAFGADFGSVRVHAGSKADSLNRSISARAFTTGQDIFFRQGQYNPNSSGGRELLAHELTHVVQQNQDVVQPKAQRTTLGPAKQADSQRKVQRNIFTKAGRGIKRGFKSLFGIGKGKREGKLTQKYGMTVGSGGTGKAHFSHGMMDKVEKVLKQLPESHYKGNEHMLGVETAVGEDRAEMGAASFFDYGREKIYMNRPMEWMPWWLYTKLSPKWGWQRKMMDKGAMEGYKGISQEGDEALGINTKDRSVFAGVSDVMVRKGGLATGTLRHEMGHAVDAKIKFTRSRAHLPIFGGWRSYKGERIGKIAEMLVKREGISPNVYNYTKFGASTLLQEITGQLENAHDAMNGYNPAQRAMVHTKKYKSDHPFGSPEEETRFQNELAEKLGKISQYVSYAKAQPWTLSDGMVDKLAVDGRIYQLDHYSHWTSYLANKRDHAVSNYQFSSPGEWFAEAYTAYYDPYRNSRARDTLEPGVRTWFEKNLGHYEVALREQAALVDQGSGKLKELLPFDPRFGAFDKDKEDTEEEVLPQEFGDFDQTMLELNNYREFDQDLK